jgi:hypothetical protein
MEQLPLLVPIPEACRLLGGISRAKLYLMLREPATLESRHIGTRRFITRRSIEAYIEDDRCACEQPSR